MWFKKTEIKKDEQIKKIVDILSSCHHLVEVYVNQLRDNNVDYRFLDMTTGYYWQISTKKNKVTIKTGDVIVIPKSPEELYKMLDIEINKSMFYEIQKQSILKINK